MTDTAPMRIMYALLDPRSIALPYLDHVRVVEPLGLQRRAYRARVDRLGEVDHDLGATAEINAPVQRVATTLDDVGVDGEHKEGDQQQGDGRPDPVLLVAK